MELIGPYLVACGLLVIAGVAKALRPDDTARALLQLTTPKAPPVGGPGGRGPGGAHRWTALRLPGMRSAVRVGAAAEALLGVVALVVPRSGTAAAVAASYLAFAVVVGLTMARGGPLATCGCFGRPDTPPTFVHLAVDLVLAVAATAVAVAAPPSGTVVGVLAHQPWHGVPLVMVALLGTWLATLVLVRLSALEAARRQIAVGAGGA